MAEIETELDTGIQSTLADDLRKSMGINKPISFKKSRKTLDLSEPQDLIDYAATKGITAKVDKPSLFRRTLDLLSRGNYMSANLAKDVADGGEFAPLQSAWRGLSGQDKTTYSDVLDVAGMENKILRGGLGFVLDVALDPTTYFGGSLIKGTGKLAKAVASPVGNVIAKSQPVFANHIIDSATSLQDAFGSLFKYGFKVTPGIRDEIGTTLNKIGMSRDEIIDKYTNIFKGLDKTQQTQFAETLIDARKKIRKYEVGKVKELTKTGLTEEEALRIARKEGNDLFKPKFGDELQQEVFDKQLVPQIDELANKAGLDERFKVEAYYPMMDIKEMKRQESVGRVLAQGSKGYLKEFKDKIADPDLLKKPIEAFSRREAEVVRDVINKETLEQSVKNYGLSKEAFDKLDDAEKLLYKEIKDKKLGGKSVGYLKSRDAEFINDSLFPEMKSIDMLARSFGYDKMTRVFKTAVTSWFPSFHVRNAFSGIAQNYEVFGKEGLNPLNYMDALGVMKKTDIPMLIKSAQGKVMFEGTGKELQQKIAERFSGSSRYIADLSSYIDDFGDGRFAFKKMVDPGRQLGNAIETFHKTAATIMGLKQGKGLDEAMNLAEKAGFDYTKITKFEAKVMRRLIPFYTFMRKNAGLQLSTLANHPERILNQAKMAGALSEMFGGKVTEEDVKGLPNWVLSGLGFKIEGDKYLSSFGLPVEEFIDTMNRPMMKTLTSLNPIIKYPLESKLGFDFFRGKEIVDINDVAPATGKRLYDMDQKGMLPDWLSESLNIKKRTYQGKDIYEMSPKQLHRLRNLPTSRLQNTLEKLFDEDLDAVNKWTAFFSGAKIYDIDKEKQMYFKEKDLKTDIQRQLLELGEGQQFKTFYIYK